MRRITWAEPANPHRHTIGNMDTVRLAIVDNDAMAIMALGALLRRAGFSVLWSARLGVEAIQRCIRPQDRPDVLLVDMALTDMTGIDVCRGVRTWDPTLPMVGVTAYDPLAYREAAMAAGVTAVVSKDDPTTLVATIRKVCAGTPCDGSTDTTNPTDATDATEQTTVRSFALSSQQMAIMRLYAEGRSTEEVASRLGISKGTVFSQVARVRDKLQARDRNEAVALCRRYLRM